MSAAGVETFDIAIIGAGMAGASVASELAGSARVLLVERESQPGYHTTGRSAALFSEIYGPPPIRALSRASASFFDNPPAGFSAAPLLAPRGALMAARKDQMSKLKAEFEVLSDRGAVEMIDEDALRARLPIVRPGHFAAAIFERRASDIDVHGLHHGYLRRFRALGGRVETGCEIRSLDHVSGAWRIEAGARAFEAGIVVNAAGAWADEIAALAGIGRIGLVPKRRTAVIVPAPDGQETAHWPMLVDIDEQFYLKPDAGRLLVSPADETPSPPCDAQPEELDIAICVDRIETAFDLSIRRIENKWAGLRSFVADGSPVAGFDPAAPGFFWLAGQGGYGIQSAPALARLAAAQIMQRPVPTDIADQGLDVRDLAASRLALAA